MTRTSIQTFCFGISAMIGTAPWLLKQSGLETKVPPGFLRRPREKCRGGGTKSGAEAENAALGGPG
jgi:hypothetical protein